MSNWIKRTFQIAWDLQRDGIKIDKRAWDDNVNTDIDLSNWEYENYFEPTI